MRPEIELLLCCARTQLDALQADRVRSLIGVGIDWDHLSRLAHTHGVVPLLYRNLHSCCPEAVPEAVLAQLRDAFQANVQRNLSLTQELLKLLALFESQSIPVAPLKGPVLAVSVYRNLGLRMFCDLDLLVQKQDALRARDLLVSQGYQATVETTRAQEASFVRTERALSLRRQDSQVQVDLQWSIPADWLALRAFPLSPKELLGRLEPFSLGGVSASWFSPEDLLLVLCVHGASHGWRELKLTCDIAELIRRRPQLDWRKAVAQASAWGIRRVLFLGLRLAHDLLGVSLPGEVEALVLADSDVGSLTAQVHEWLWLFGGSDGPNHLFEEAAFYVRLRERQRDRLAYSLFYLWAYLQPGLAPADEDRTLSAFPKPLTSLGCAIRPFWMVARYGLRPLRPILRILYRQFCR